MITLTLNANIPKTNQPEFFQAIASIGQEVRRFRGCLGYHIFQDMEQGNQLNVESSWADQVSLKSFLSSRVYTVTLGAFKTFSLSPVVKYGETQIVDPESLFESI